MGLSASQARLISLEARMSDVEYEGQQINQQRLVLSNKMNEIQERVYNMDVPTPPSKQDFMYDVYTGKTRGGKPVKVTINGDGSLNVAQTKSGTVVVKGDTVKVTNGSTVTVDGQQVSLEAGYQMWQKPVTDTTYDPEDLGRTFDVTVPALQRETQTCTDQAVLAALAGVGNSTSAGNWKVPSGVNITYDTDYTFANGATTKEEDGKTITANKENGIPKYSNFKASGPLETGYMIEDPNNKYNLTVSGSGPSASSYSQLCSDLSGGYYLKSDVADLSSSSRTCLIKDRQYNLGELPALAAKALNESGFKGLNWAFKDPQCTQKFTWEDAVIDQYTFQPRTGMMRYNKMPKNTDSSSGTDGTAGATGSSSGITVNGNETITIAEAKARFENDPDSSWAKSYSGLKQTMGTYNNRTESRDFDESAWMVVLNKTEKGTINFTFVKTEDLAKGEGAEIQEYKTEQGDYEEDPTRVDANGPDVEYDPDTGHIVKVRIDGQDIILQYGQECNEVEYDKAQNKYLYMKSLYDQEQNQLNKQTSIYQRQDKQLELKLTRLDTERNSLNTEIEAVKKVIQDAAEDFKTFSG